MANYTYVVLFAVFASVYGNAVNRAGWSSGWTTSPPTIPPTIPPGWGPSGWGAPSSVNIALSGELAAVGAGAASESHSETIQVVGDAGTPAELAAASGGEAVLFQEGSIIQATNVDDDSASSVNAVSVAQAAEADEGLAVIASGVDIIVAQVGAAEVSGLGASAAAADTIISVNP